MSPEQVTGQGVDGRSDIYSLGCVLYEMLAGRLPFSSSNDPRVLVQHPGTEPEPLTAQRPGLSSTVDDVVRRALHASPAIDTPRPGTWRWH